MTNPATTVDRTGEFDAVFASERAFRAWYEASLPRVYGYVMAHAAGERDLAEEITQATFVDAIRGHARFDGRADTVTWLCSIARNKLADHYRRLDRQDRRRLQLVVRAIDVEGDVAAWRTVDDREQTQAVLRSLPPLQREALVLLYLDGYSVREVARQLGRTESAAESLLSRARANFRRAYGEPADD
jgi:RNA polymerase sigma-70 factor, ECF subfamily